MRLRYLALLPLLAACDATGPDWDYEGVIESGHHRVVEVGMYSEITCQVNGVSVPTYTGEGGSGARCLKHYHTVRRDSMVYPVHTLYIRDGRYGAPYKVRVR